MSGKYFLLRKKNQKISEQPISKQPISKILGNFTNISRSPSLTPSSKRTTINRRKSLRTGYNSFIPTLKKTQFVEKPFSTPYEQISVIMKSQKLKFNSSRKKENLRYQQKNLEETESNQNLNVISTPPEEISYERSVSPFSDIIEQDLSQYLNQNLSGFSKLSRPNYLDICIENNSLYSIPSRKTDTIMLSNEKSAKTPEPPKYPPFSIFSKINRVQSGRTKFKSTKKYL
jgi:hypothetical protein